jgi:hypothetical protein
VSKLQALLDQLKQLDAEATSGPWDAIHIYDGEEIVTAGEDARKIGVFQKLADSKTVALHRNNIPLLIAVIEKLIEQRDMWIIANDRTSGEERAIMGEQNKEIDELLED